jgi:hypothetical protein
MERRSSLNRARVDFPVFALVDGFRHACRAIDLSSTGMVIARSRSLRDRELGILNAFELHLKDSRPIRGRARSVWTRDGLHAVRFVTMNDVDRLSIAEHLDRMARLHEEVH